ncbi:MAG: hypothetical protein FVQ80_11420 [Planctomycetes bacterium]|nr:hypothetical protein [Planctomycetota bacterium]
MSDNEVLSLVPDERLAEIKQQDTSPMFVMMTVGYEGESKGKLFESLASGKKLKEWFKQLWPLKAVKALVTLMRGEDHIPIYEAHEPGKSGRLIVGNIVSATKKVIDGVTHALGVAYITNFSTKKKIKTGELNACSLEAECLFQANEGALRFIVQEVRKLAGVALCNADTTPTGFDNSNILAVVNAMAEEDKAKVKGVLMAEGDITTEDVRKFVEQHKMVPTDLFSVKTILEQKSVSDALENEIKNAVADKEKAVKEVEAKLQPFLDAEANSEISTLINKSEVLKDTDKATVKYLVDTMKVDVAGKDDKQKVVDAAVTKQLEVMKTSGVTIKPSGSKDESENTEGKEANEADNKNADRVDGQKIGKEFTSKETNPLIPGHEEAKAKATANA